MFDFKYDEEFEPSKRVLRLWLYTKKNDNPVCGLILPGFFNHSDNSIYAIGFACVLLIEGAATIWVKSLGLTIETILAFIVVDIVLAIWGHLAYGKIIKYRNYLLTTNDTNESDDKIQIEKAALKKEYSIKIKNWKTYKIIFNILIIISGVFKFIWFYIDYLVFNSTTLLIGFFYLVGAILHILCTGFFLYTFYLKKKIKYQYRKYPRKYRFDKLNPRGISIKANLVEGTSGRHKIQKISDGDYTLITNGILTDENLSELIGRQEDEEQKRKVAIKGIEHQLNLMT